MTRIGELLLFLGSSIYIFGGGSAPALANYITEDASSTYTNELAMDTYVTES